MKNENEKTNYLDSMAELLVSDDFKDYGITALRAWKDIDNYVNNPNDKDYEMLMKESIKDLYDSIKDFNENYSIEQFKKICDQLKLI